MSKPRYGDEEHRYVTQSVAWYKILVGAVLAASVALLTDPAASQELEIEMVMESVSPASRLELGRNLAEWLQPAEQRVVSRNAGLWNWLSLRLFDQLCPPHASGKRRVLDTPHYVLDPIFSHRQYYRQLVRFAWIAYVMHGQCARVLLSQSSNDSQGLGQWGDLSEQLGARQEVLASRTIIEAAGLLYLDKAGTPICGFATRGHKGVVHRLVAIVEQLGLTYDLRTCRVDDFLNLLPNEFERWVCEYRKRTSKEARKISSAGVAEASDSSELRA